MRANYQRIGDYIRPVDVRNKDLSITNLVGLTIDKLFIPSVANTIGTDFSNYKIIRRNQFACSLMQVSRDGKIPIAMYQEDAAIMSPAYPMFEVSDPESLLPGYLMLWFKRSEFDREASFYAVGGVRGSLEWNDFCNMKLPVPPIEEQKRIVAQYQAVDNRIRNNERLIARLEDTAQAIYHHRFVDNIDPNNLPDGWGSIDIGAFCKQMVSGGTPNRKNGLYYEKPEIPWLKSGEVHNNVILDTEEYISRIGYDNSATKMVPDNTVIMAMYGATASEVGFLKKAVCTNQACCNMICDSYNDACYLYYYLRHEQEEIKRLANGGAQENLNKELISSYPILRPNDEDISVFSKLMDYQVAISKEISLDKSIVDLIVSQMV